MQTIQVCDGVVGRTKLTSKKESRSIVSTTCQFSVSSYLWLVHCPFIVVSTDVRSGQELVKAGLTLAIFGGSPKFSSDRNRIPVRGDPHVLVVGDPGLGKSQVSHQSAVLRLMYRVRCSKQ